MDREVVSIEGEPCTSVDREVVSIEGELHQCGQGGGEYRRGGNPAPVWTGRW